MSRVALVTGASRGIGRAIAERLIARGDKVAVSYRVNHEMARQLGAALAVQADMTDADQIRELASRVELELGPVEILVNNAGLLVRGDIEDGTLDDLEAMRKVNVDGLIHMTRAVVPHMKARGWGRIVNLTSIAAHGTAMAGTTFYAATKSAVSLLTRRFALDLGRHGITVNAVAPGFILTDMVTVSRSPDEVEKLSAAIAAKAMVGRVGTPDDIAHAAAFLTSEEAGFITAQVLTVDGGRTDYIAHP